MTEANYPQRWDFLKGLVICISVLSFGAPIPVEAGKTLDGTEQAVRVGDIRSRLCGRNAICSFQHTGV